MALLSVATAVGTYLQGALSVLAADVIEEFDISRSQLGLAFLVFSMTGATGSPLMGKLADVSTRRVMAILFAAGASGIVLAGTAPGFPWLLAAAFVGGLGLAAGNPVTNRIVADRISMRRRGIVIGIKQAGPPMGLLAAGLALPPLAAVFGWRGALVLTATLPLLGLVATRALVPRHNRTVEAPPETIASVAHDRAGRVAVRWLGVIGLVVAMGGGGLIAFIPLFAEEAVGLSATAAGLLAALMGLSGVVGRVVWGANAAKFQEATTPLSGLAFAAGLATISVWAGTTAVWLLWLGVVALGGTMLAWHAVSWVALLNAVEAPSIGRATGVVQLGNSVGFASGPPVIGLLIDQTGSYGWGWAVVTCLFGLAAVLTLLWRHVSRPRGAS